MASLMLCALPGCTTPIKPGILPYRIGSNPEEYCSRGCVNIAFELMRKGKKYKQPQAEKVNYLKEDEKEELAEARASIIKEDEGVKVKAEEFGGAGVYRRYCDNPACKGPITVCWKGRRGEYCSNSCLKTEKENTMTTNEETVEESPIAAGAPASKKKGKAAKKAAPVKKAAKKTTKKVSAAPSERAEGNAKVIQLVKSEKLPEYRGVKTDITKQIKDGITVGQYKANVASKVPGKHSWDAKNVLEAAVEAGAIKIK
jgi:hypothetical protein